MPTLDEIVREVDRRSAGRPFGTLQERRRRIQNLDRRPSLVPFGSANDEYWAFHIGGRTELQFNLGLEEGLPSGNLRYGVAFSFETSRSLPSIDILLPKAARFNDFILEHPEDVAGLWMWHFGDGREERTRVGPYAPRVISAGLFRHGVFVFLGGIGSSDSPDYDAILDTLDALLPLWEYVESHDAVASPTSVEPPLRRELSQRAATTGTRSELTLNIELRHNVIQRRLLDLLIEEHGEESVGVEFEATGGGRVDAIVLTRSERVLYEVKTATSARACIREALGQLLDYGCWPGRIQATRLVIVGSGARTPEAVAYLERLSGLVPLTIAYCQVAIDPETL
jgi:hypothetical protein